MIEWLPSIDNEKAEMERKRSHRVRELLSGMLD